MLPSTSAWSSHYGSNFPASSSLTNFGERSHHRMAAAMMSNQSPSSSHWGSGGVGHVVHRPHHHETGFAAPPPVDLRYQQQAADAWMRSASPPRGSAGGGGGFAVKDELSDASEYSSSEDACSDYRDALGGGAGQDYRGGGGELGDRSRRTTTDRRADSGESMTAEEVEKRRVRRERNKMAAARCRQRRVDLTNQLLAETETLEDERDSLQKEIQALQRQRSQLEDLLGSHAPQCKSRALIGGGAGGGGSGGHTIDIPPIKTEKCDDYFNIADTGLRRASCNSYSLPTTTFQSCSRPDSLPLTRRPKLLIAAGGGGGGTAAGSVSNLGLDCMLDGHTGLTPITGAPSAPEGIIRSPPVECGGYSPTTLMTL